MKLKGSYTIEATYIMAITLFALMTVFGSARRLQNEITAYMHLHEQVEQMRYQAEPSQKRIVQSTEGNGWSLEIWAGIYDQEAWLREISLIEE